MMDIEFGYYPENRTMLRLPNTLLCASPLTSLTLHKCQLPSSLMVGVVKFKSLRLLSKNCPLLEEICLRYCYGFKRIDVEAPNLSYFLLWSNKDKAPSIFLSSCKKLTTFYYRGFPLIRFNDFLSNFPFLENVALDPSFRVNNLKLSNNSLRKIQLQSGCNLDEIDLNAPTLHLFKLCDQISFNNFAPLSREDSSMSKECIKCETAEYFDILWFQKLRGFLDKNGIFKVLKLVIYREVIDVEKLKMIQSPPRELEHVELIIPVGIRGVAVYATVLDAVLGVVGLDL
ncbi:F-box domain containing protein [Tanacetum coccineum]